jgi:hypothetical protein
MVCSSTAVVRLLLLQMVDHIQVVGGALGLLAASAAAV